MVCLSVGRSVTIVSPAKTAETIEIKFLLWSRVGPRKHRWGAHWLHPANTIEPSMCGSDAASLSNYFDHLFYIFKQLSYWLKKNKLINGFYFDL